MTARVLTVCTGNICRSPYLEMRLHQELETAWGPDGFEVISAGVNGLVGMGMEPEAARAVRRHGPMPKDHYARRLTAPLVASADLVLTATRVHRTATTTLHPRSLGYAFTLADFAHLCASVPDEDLPRGASVGEQLRTAVALIASRRGFVPPLEPEQADLVDPFRQSDQAWERMIGDAEAALVPILRVLSPR